jgi:methionine synthase I (cobalamin-dependent)
MDLLEELQARVLCGDGAMGTLLLEAGFPLERCFEELSVSEPDRIEKIHQQYIGAGARVIATNTFGANAVRLERFGFEGRVAEINHAAAAVAVKAARGKGVYVAGSVGPLGISRDEARERGIDRKVCYREQIEALLEGGVDLIFFETFMEFEEMEIALLARREMADGLTICSFAGAPDARNSAGLPPADAFAKLRGLKVEIFGVNCLNDPQQMLQILRSVPDECFLSAYPNAGYPRLHDGRLIYDTSPEQFANAAREMAGAGFRLIGGCCGTTPRHIAAMTTAIANMKPERNEAVRAVSDSRQKESGSQT